MDLTSESNNYQNYATQVRYFFISRDLISLGDVIDLGSNLTYIVIKSTFNWLFQSEFKAGILLVAMKSIKVCPKYIKIFEIDQKRSKIIEKVKVYIQLNLTFVIF